MQKLSTLHSFLIRLPPNIGIALTSPSAGGHCHGDLIGIGCSVAGGLVVVINVGWHYGLLQVFSHEWEVGPQFDFLTHLLSSLSYLSSY